MRHAKYVTAIASLLLLVAIVASTTGAYFPLRLSYALRPTPERALTLGSMHFDSTRPYLYDIDDAERFLHSAYDQDPNLPTISHQLARIAFLRGDFRRAMAFIDQEISLQGESFPNAFYMRGLIRGYQGHYHEAALDYVVYLKHDPHNWSALTDYAWVLTKAGRTDDARNVLKGAVSSFPHNPWLLNLYAVVLYEVGEYREALIHAHAAQRALENLTEQDWLVAYPGNDPATARSGIRALKDAVDTNMHMVARVLAVHDVQ